MGQRLTGKITVQRRVQLRDGSRIQLLSRSSPVVFVVFDLLYLHGESIMAKTLVERRGRLEEMVNDFKAASVALSEAVLTQGRDLFAAAMKLGQEGIMAKLLNGHYAPGRRTGPWKKIKRDRGGSGASGIAAFVVSSYADFGQSFQVCHVLRCEIGASASEYKTEDAFLRGTSKYLKTILKDPKEYLDSWDLLGEIDPEVFKQGVRRVQAHIAATLKSPRDQRGKPPFEEKG